jgi:hypothetical protein
MNSGKSWMKPVLCSLDNSLATDFLPIMEDHRAETASNAAAQDAFIERSITIILLYRFAGISVLNSRPSVCRDTQCKDGWGSVLRNSDGSLLPNRKHPRI